MELCVGRDSAHSTIEELIALHPNARIIDTPPLGHNGEGVRLTIGGNPRSDYDNTIGYFDALIIGTRDKQISTLYDFTCNQSPRLTRANTQNLTE